MSGSPRNSESRPFDSRTEVTPEAFEISPDLLGLPLAGPWSRLLALLVDGILVGVLSLAGPLFLGIAAAVFFFRMAASKSRGEHLARAFRGVMGCFGMGLLFVTGCGLFLFLGSGGGDGGDLPTNDLQVAPSISGDGEELSVDLGDVFSGISEVQRYRGAETEEEARVSATRVAQRLAGAGASAADIREVLRELAPTNASWQDELDSIVAEAVDRRESRDEVTTRGDSIPENEDGRPPDSLALPEEIADTVTTLEARLEQEREDRAIVEAQLELTRQDLEEARGGSFLGWIEDLLDELGLAFGWWAIYMTVFLTWWNGRTPGKRLMNIRVRQLDGTPLSWWEAFERSGGYAAGFATGLLGFLQVFWDPNRQAIHDKIAETVVVSEKERS